jgi:hypothetical protein
MQGADTVVRQGVGGFSHLVFLESRELTIDPYKRLGTKVFLLFCREELFGVSCSFVKRMRIRPLFLQGKTKIREHREEIYDRC